jgi:hypothetical protein
MKEKILALLTAKFAGVRKDGLAQLAGALSFQATTDEEATALIDKLTTDSVDNFVKDWRKDVDKEVSEANKTYEGNLKKKFDFVEKKNQEPEPPTPPTPGDDTPAWAKALIEQNKALADRLNNFEGGKIKETRLQSLESKLKEVPESFKAQKLKDFGRMNFETDEAFTEYLNETETDITALNQELADKGLAGQGKPFFGNKNSDGTSSAVASFIASKTDDANKLGGKEI